MHPSPDMDPLAFSTYPHVDIILVNWNSAADTLECLESVFRLNYPSYRVLVCDNASNDDSLGKIENWASTGSTVSPASKHFLPLLTGPRLKAPFPFVRYTRPAAESVSLGQKDPVLVLIETGGNLGFAGGNNVGLRYSLSQGDAKYVWLLNTDTVVDSNALKKLVERIRNANNIGSVGSTLIQYWNPELTQATGGGFFNPKNTRTGHIGADLPTTNPMPNEKTIETQTSYVIGASMLISKEVLQQVGLMCEDYFLYFEELDWAQRMQENFTIAYASGSLVYHKMGGSSKKVASLFSLQFLYRNRLVFVARFFPSRFLYSIFDQLYEMLRLLVKGNWRRALLILNCVGSSKALFTQGKSGRGKIWR